MEAQETPSKVVSGPSIATVEEAVLTSLAEAFMEAYASPSHPKLKSTNTPAGASAKRVAKRSTFTTENGPSATVSKLLYTVTKLSAGGESLFAGVQGWWESKRLRGIREGTQELS